MVKAKKAEKAKPKTEAEKLEATRKEALDKLDFYERVVRSVAREEAEVAGYYEIMNEDVDIPNSFASCCSLRVSVSSFFIFFLISSKISIASFSS